MKNFSVKNNSYRYDVISNYLYICIIIAHNGDRSKYPIALINEHESVQNVFRSSVIEIQNPGRKTNAKVMKDV